VSGGLTLSADARSTAGELLIAIVAVEWGGTFMLRVVRRRVPLTPFQRAFSRAGHAHAGVLVIAALIGQILADAADLDGFPAMLARSGVPLAAILFPAGFFFLLDGKGSNAAEPDDLAAVYGRGRARGERYRAGSRASSFLIVPSDRGCGRTIVLTVPVRSGQHTS
jgi:hypothetical protein